MVLQSKYTTAALSSYSKSDACRILLIFGLAFNRPEKNHLELNQIYLKIQIDPIIIEERNVSPQSHNLEMRQISPVTLP